MTKKASYTLLRNWTGPDDKDWEEALGALTKDQLRLLCSDASMTLDLESLLGSRLAVEVRLRDTTTVDRDEALYLGEDVGSEAFEREVWLTAGDRRVLYARTLIPIERIDPKLIEALEKGHAEPIGRVLNSKKIPFSKKRLEFGVVCCERLAADLGVDGRTPLAARRYILKSENIYGGLAIKASVTEIFSPELVSAAPQKTGKALDV